MGNIETFRKGMKEAKKKIFKELEKRLHEIGLRMIEIAVANKKWTGFTGNAQTSFAIGVYRDGKLSSYLTGEAFQNAPLRKKIKYGKTVYLQKPYEGEARAVTGKEDVTDNTGPEASVDFLKQFVPPRTAKLALVMTIGVEYAIFLATPSDYGVLRDAVRASDKLVWRRIERPGIEIK